MILINPKKVFLQINEFSIEQENIWSDKLFLKGRKLISWEFLSNIIIMFFWLKMGRRKSVDELYKFGFYETVCQAKKLGCDVILSAVRENE